MEWVSLEAHEVLFRQSAQYQKWKELLHDYYDPFPQILHYEDIKMEKFLVTINRSEWLYSLNNRLSIHMKIYTETERLLLREILPTDVDAMFAMDSDSEVHKYLGNNPVKDKEQIRGVIEFIRGQYVEFGIGRRAIVDKKTNQFMGWAGLK